MTTQFAAIIAELEEALKALEPAFLGLPERGETATMQAYRRGVRDAYQIVLWALKEDGG